jgi:hypothetical protein
LFVLIDNDSASASELFSEMTKQLPGTILIGENTVGGCLYGSTGSQHACDLRHSGLTAEFGNMRFTPFIRPFREGIGLFPDYWLDSSDPIADVSAYCAEKK